VRASYALVLARLGAEHDTVDRLVRDSESTLATMGDRLNLGLAHCSKGRILCLRGDREGARTALTEAEDLLSALELQPTSHLGKEIAGLRTLLGLPASNEG
jgi:hypothetical protein